MSKFKHFTLSERITLERLLKNSCSFKAIGRELNKDCTSLSKEVRNHLILKRLIPMEGLMLQESI